MMKAFLFFDLVSGWSELVKGEPFSVSDSFESSPQNSFVIASFPSSSRISTLFNLERNQGTNSNESLLSLAKSTV